MALLIEFCVGKFVQKSTGQISLALSYCLANALYNCDSILLPGGCPKKTELGLLNLGGDIHRTTTNIQTVAEEKSKMRCEIFFFYVPIIRASFKDLIFMNAKCRAIKMPI